MRLVAVMPHTHTVSYVAGISKMAAASEVRRLLVDTLPHTHTDERGARFDYQATPRYKGKGVEQGAPLSND